MNPERRNDSGVVDWAFWLGRRHRPLLVGLVVLAAVLCTSLAAWSIPLSSRPTGTGPHYFGLDKDGVGYSLDDFNKNLVSADALEAAETAKKKIIAGEIKVTDAMGS